MSPRLQSVMDKLEYAELPSFEGVSLSGPNARSRVFGDTPLHIFAIWGDVESAEILIQEGAEIDAQGEDNFTPLHNAIEQNRPEIVKLLLKYGANRFLCTCDGSDAWELAGALEHKEICELLNENQGA